MLDVKNLLVSDVKLEVTDKTLLNDLSTNRIGLLMKMARDRIQRLKFRNEDGNTVICEIEFFDEENGCGIYLERGPSGSGNWYEFKHKDTKQRFYKDPKIVHQMIQDNNYELRPC
jgi:hypothetical protein